MTEPSEQPTESTTGRAGTGTGSNARPNRIYRIAAGVWIVVGGVIITGAVFAFGLLIGSLSSEGGDAPGYWTDADAGHSDSSQYDEEGWYGDDQDWGNSSFGPGGELPTAPGASQTNPPAVTPR
ncbi:hypothetical protein [Mycolicibacterium fluoranthenivorans]|uniref:Uncharacterized protein n=1 Tax=Mycolicibacterium fluoranthenivorans TaxID=258505 RepID=A0A7X5U0Q5_9MYCO|nr:hypothetical protein [Mycolicibacterium fluoranthenivorans]MCV7357629.1 hypothetical protein [Mycolicibacterium fluoranthenivorans]NIH96261.1 hypothetical protein [Mycolicibacterium fluoranthenivorans]